jgi:hypothetical protein
MHATDLIHANLGVACQSIHRTRFNALLTAVAAALAGQTTSVTGLGRSSQRQITEKASINMCCAHRCPWAAREEPCIKSVTLRPSTLTARSRKTF